MYHVYKYLRQNKNKYLMKILSQSLRNWVICLQQKKLVFPKTGTPLIFFLLLIILKNIKKFLYFTILDCPHPKFKLDTISYCRNFLQRSGIAHIRAFLSIIKSSDKKKTHYFETALLRFLKIVHF